MNKMSGFSTVEQPPPAVRADDSRGRLSHIPSNPSAELIELLFRGALAERLADGYG
jgi:hypothetical protein